MIKFTCNQCGKIHEFDYVIEFGFPKETLLKLKSGDLKCETSDRWSIINENHYMVKGLITVPIFNVKENFKWLVWVAVDEMGFHAYINWLKSFPKEKKFETPGVLFAEMTFLEKSLGLEVYLEANSIQSYPLIKVIDNTTDLGKIIQNEMPREQVLKRMSRLYH